MLVVTGLTVTDFMDFIDVGHVLFCILSTILVQSGQMKYVSGRMSQRAGDQRNISKSKKSKNGVDRLSSFNVMLPSTGKRVVHQETLCLQAYYRAGAPCFQSNQSRFNHLLQHMEYS